jgi:hypothetical protein
MQHQPAGKKRQRNDSSLEANFTRSDGSDPNLVIAVSVGPLSKSWKVRRLGNGWAASCVCTTKSAETARDLADWQKYLPANLARPA